MKILHIGGYHSVTMSLAKHQLDFGHEVTVMGTSGSEYYFEMPFACIEVATQTSLVAEQKYDIIQFHLTESLCNFHLPESKKIEATLSVLKQSGAKLLFYSYGPDFLGRRAAREKLGIDEKIFEAYFDHIFIGSADNIDLALVTDNWSWLGLGVDLKSIPLTSSRIPKPNELNFLHIPYRVSPKETKFIADTFEALAKKGLKFKFTLLPPEKILKVRDLHYCLSDCDVFIEQIERKSFGPLALEAMARGTTVLSGNATSAKQVWSQLEMCPILDTNAENLYRRLESILREPRCLRDLSKRSRGFVENNHNVEIMNRLVIDKYEEMIG